MPRLAILIHHQDALEPARPTASLAQARRVGAPYGRSARRTSQSMVDQLRSFGLDVWLPFAGRLHITLVHFPIALLVAAAWLEFARLRRGRFEPRPAAVACLGLGALTAAVSAGLGWIWADVEPVGERLAGTLVWHRWIGISVAGIALLAWFDALAQRRAATRGSARRLRSALVLLAVGVAVTGHLGGSMAWGPDFLSGPLERAWRGTSADEPPTGAPDRNPPRAPGRSSESASAAGSAAEQRERLRSDVPDERGDGRIAARPGSVGAEPALGDAPESESEPDGSGAASAQVAFGRDVWPIFADRCIACHGPRKQKGDLRLDRESDVFGGELFEGVVVRYDPDSSELMRRIALSPDDPDFMPKGDDPLTADELASLRAWIEAGAAWDAAVAATDG